MLFTSTKIWTQFIERGGGLKLIDNFLFFKRPLETHLSPGRAEVVGLYSQVQTLVEAKIHVYI